MDVQALVQALTNTLDPQLREQAEAVLEEVHRLPDFTPCLLQIIMNDGVPLACRQAGAVYLKNCLFKYWRDRELDESGEEQPYSIPDPAKVVIRDHVIGAIIQAPTLICRQLCICLEHILKLDFPKKWTGIVTTTHAYLASDNQATWRGSLLALYQLSKKYKFKKGEDRREFIEAMKTILPLLYQRMMEILPDASLPAVTLQHHILKIFYAIMEYELPLDLINADSLPGWVFVLLTIVQRPVPPGVAAGVDEEELPQLEWWKCKKWTLHILCRLYDRYGSPHNVEKCYAQFASYYMKTFNSGVINALLRQLEVKRQGAYVSPRVVQGIFNYFVEAVDHAASWKLIKPHFQVIFAELVFPMMCYSEEDNTLWHDDPYEFIRQKYDIFEDLISPLVAAQHFLTRACAKRKNVLDPVMAFCVSILNTRAEQRDPTKKDGALHVIGSIAEVLLTKKSYKSLLESMLVTHVFPEFQNELGYMRARACWMLHYFSETEFTNTANLQFALERVFTCLTQDKELPVKVEAAVALQHLIHEHTVAESFIKPYIKPIIQELLVVMRETENDDLTNVLQQLIETYADEIEDVAVSLCHSLVSTFNEIVDPHGESTDEDSYKALTALGILSALQSLVKAVFNDTKTMAQMENMIISVAATMLQNGVIDFYEEMLALLDLFTTTTISQQMWQILFIIYEAFSRDGVDYFTEMMSVLYNFVKVDTDTFLSNPKHLEVVMTMCKSILAGEPGEDCQVHAAKLLEVVVLQCQGRIDSYIPTITEAVLERLTRESKTPEVRTMCIQVVVAALYCNTTMLLELLEKTHFPDSQEPITAQFFNQWIKDADLFSGIHDRKMSVLGLCAVLQCPVRPAPVLKLAASIVPAITVQLDALVDAYKLLADEEAEVREGEEEANGGLGQNEEDVKELDSEEDDIDEDGQEYLKRLSAKAGQMLGDDSSDEEEDAQTLLEIDYETVVDDENLFDEFCTFKTTLQSLSASDPEWYAALTSQLPPEQGQLVQKLFLTADQRVAARESRKIELAGGYSFNVTQVPNAFVFTSP